MSSIAINYSDGGLVVWEYGTDMTQGYDADSIVVMPKLGVLDGQWYQIKIEKM